MYGQRPGLRVAPPSALQGTFSGKGRRGSGGRLQEDVLDLSMLAHPWLLQIEKTSADCEKTEC